MIFSLIGTDVRRIKRKWHRENRNVFIEYFYYEKFDNLIEENEREKCFRRSLLFLRVRTYT